MLTSRILLSKMLVLAILTLSLRTVSTHAMQVEVNHSIHIPACDNETVHKIGKGIWHTGQLISIGIILNHLYHLDGNSFSYPRLALIGTCSSIAAYTLAGAGLKGLQEVCTKKQTTPEKIKETSRKLKHKIKQVVHDW